MINDAKRWRMRLDSVVRRCVRSNEISCFVRKYACGKGLPASIMLTIMLGSVVAHKQASLLFSPDCSNNILRCISNETVFIAQNIGIGLGEFGGKERPERKNASF